MAYPVIPRNPLWPQEHLAKTHPQTVYVLGPPGAQSAEVNSVLIPEIHCYTLPAVQKRPTGIRINNRDKQMGKGQCMNTITKSQGNMAPPEASYCARESLGYAHIAEAQEDDLKTNPIKTTEASIKKWIKSHKEIQENIIKEVKEMKKTVKEEKMEKT